MDFDGINLRRKFLTGLEPESINMTIGENILVFHVVNRVCVCVYMELPWFDESDHVFS